MSHSYYLYFCNSEIPDMAVSEGNKKDIYVCIQLAHSWILLLPKVTKCENQLVFIDRGSGIRITGKTIEN